MPKLDYMLSLLWLLRSRGKMTAEQLAEALEISVRTVYRYVDLLCQSGVPVVAEPGHGGGFTLPDSFRESPLFFDTNELKAMAHSARIASQAGYPFADALEHALDKISHRLNEDQGEQLRRHQAGLEAVPYSTSREIKRLLSDLEEAAAHSRVCCIQYANTTGDAERMRHIHPYRLAYRTNRWYVAAYCELRGSVRMFRVDRIEQLEVTEETFARPEDVTFIELARDTLAGYSKTDASWVTVRIGGDSDVLESIGNQYFVQPFLTKHMDRELRFEMPPSVMLTYMPHLLLSFGTLVSVLEPSLLGERISELCHEIAEHHTSPKLP
ncbi:hypothetical protein BK138_18365 [Paenibacillus rhizosphaerae]|uniref:Transcriptional regulator n=1 Tax=Paenibacillus rhizosphaerae TaxID=297318 RepID=A0A1R1EPP9_9BACL|nr:WYL domain-containing protein [Paenibacillus rhizosphaerae]OMF53781.1 hypothetical protein BK138_18365 [Paenibacillus rhizosphaerae]